MLQRILLGMLVIGLCGAAWGRSEFRLGGDGISWQSLLTEGETNYVIVDGSGNVLSTLPVGISTEDAGIDTMIDFANNGIGPVWIDPADNLSLSLAERKGHLNSSVSTGYSREAAKELQVMIDGDSDTAVLKRVELSPRLQGLNIGYVKNLVVNLGAELPINRIRFFPRPGFEENYLQWYEIGVADDTAPFVSFPGERAPGKRWYRDINRSLTSNNDPGFDILKRNEENLDIEVDLNFPTEDLHWIAIRPINAERDWEIAEFEIYGEGFVGRTSYTSPILDFGRPVAWSKIRWEGERPEGTEVRLRTRTGNTPQPNHFWRVGSTGDFEPVSREDYQAAYNAGLFSQLRQVYDRDNWGTWSPPYDFDAGLRDANQPDFDWTDGVVLQSPSPTRYLQFQVVFRGNREVAPRIDNMTLLFAEEPAAQEVFGEIWPLETENFEPQTFNYVVRPLLGTGDKGFDRLEIFTQTRVQAVHSVLVDGSEMKERFPPEIQDDRIVLSFDPLQAPRDNEKRIEVNFDAKVLRFGTEFTGWVYDSAEPNLKQQIKPGNATFRFGGDVLAVRTPMGGDLISSVQLSSPVLTPNGDGANDQIELLYDVRNVEDLSQVTVRIFDLSGSMVRQLDQTTTLSGSFALSWQGLDDQGALVRPGIYVYQVELEVDGGSKVSSGAISVAY
ncbi:MAG: hypothetical protein GKR89_18800 [Candidatus Latescibacteria bacterium]|nr:hypothetical protein [Candidatus Latescibacterota bacterium]